MKYKLTIAIFLMASICLAQNIGVIPQPQSVEKKTGFFEWTEGIKVSVSDTDGKPFDCAKFNTIFLQQIDELTESGKSKPTKKIRFQYVKSLKVSHNESQAYVMDISENDIVIKAVSESGFFNATQTLRQLYRYEALKNLSPSSATEQDTDKVLIPCMTITDFPDLEYRGWLDDVSRGPIPTMDFVKKEIEVLSYYKLNFFNLYTEHVFRLESHPDIAPIDGLTTDEIKELSEFAKRYNIELIGNQQCFAHAEETLKIPFYEKLKDGKDNLNPDEPETYRFLNDLFSEVAPAYESKLFNINCDETEGLGTGKAKKYVDSIGAETAYITHINKVHGMLKKYDKQVMMWGDIVAKSPQYISMLPSDIQFIVWSYGATDDYTDMIMPIKDSGHKFWVAPGVSLSGRCFPYIDNYIKNIAHLTRHGYLNGAKGMMNTAWDDFGESMFNAAWHGMCWGAEMSWKSLTDKGKKADRDRDLREMLFNKNFDIQFFCCAKPSMTEFLYKTSSLQDDPNIGLCVEFGKLNEPLIDFYPSKVDSVALAKNMKQEPATKLYDYINTLKQIIYNNKGSKFSPDETAVRILDNAQIAIQHMKVTAMKNVLRVHLHNSLTNTNKQNIELAKSHSENFVNELHKLKCDYFKLWDRECRTSFSEVVAKRYDDMATEVLTADRHVFIETELSEDGKPIVSLKTIYNDRDIFYSTDGSKATKNSTIYEGPFPVSNSCIVKAISFDELGNGVESDRYILYHKGIGQKMKLNCTYSDYNPTYSGGGDNALLDGSLGSDNTYKDGHWQGFQGQDIDVEIDFGKKTAVNSIEMRFLQNCFDWILSPKEIEIYTSKDGENWSTANSTKLSPDFKVAGNVINLAKIENLKVKTRFMKIVVKNPGTLPDWHPAKGYQSYIFCDEIIIK